MYVCLYMQVCVCVCVLTGIICGELQKEFGFGFCKTHSDLKTIKVFAILVSLMLLQSRNSCLSCKVKQRSLTAAFDLPKYLYL